MIDSPERKLAKRDPERQFRIFAEKTREFLEKIFDCSCQITDSASDKIVLRISPIDPESFVNVTLVKRSDRSLSVESSPELNWTDEIKEGLRNIAKDEKLFLLL